MLFSLRARNAYTVHYIFGTIHLGVQSLGHKIVQAKKYIDYTSAFYGEMDITKVDQDFQSVFNLPDGLTLRHLLSERKFEKIGQGLHQYFSMDINDWQHTKPIFLLARMAEHVLDSYGQGMDHELFRYALDRGKSIGGLETVAEQKRIAEKIPLPYQLKSLVDAITNKPKFTKYNIDLLAAYQADNVKSIYAKSKRSLGPTRPLMLYDRNTIMADRIHGLLAEQGNEANFFCFGAAHLGGDKGVLAQLKKKGYTLKQIKAE